MFSSSEQQYVYLMKENEKLRTYRKKQSFMLIRGLSIIS